MWQNSKTLIKTKLKKTNGDKTKKKSNFDKTKRLTFLQN